MGVAERVGATARRSECGNSGGSHAGAATRSHGRGVVCTEGRPWGVLSARGVLRQAGRKSGRYCELGKAIRVAERLEVAHLSRVYLAKIVPLPVTWTTSAA